MRHQFVAFLGGGIEADRIVHLIIGGIGYFLVATIDRGTAGIDQMCYLMVTADFQYVVETDEVALDIAAGVSNTVTYTCLCSEVDYYIYLVFGENVLNECFVGDAAFEERPILRQTVYFRQTFVFEIDVVVIS